jgi:hypothetical protein
MRLPGGVFLRIESACARNFLPRDSLGTEDSSSSRRAAPWPRRACSRSSRRPPGVVTSAGTGKGANGKPVRWLAVVPLADAVTLPVCVLPQNVIVVPAFHGGLLGDPNVLPTVTDFLSGGQVTAVANKDGRLRAAAEAIAGAATAWRMPLTTSDPC